MRHKLKAGLERIRAWAQQHKRLMIAMIAVLVVGLAGLGFMMFTEDEEQVARTETGEAARVEEPPEPETVASPLTGLQVTPEQAARPVTAIIIENSPDARPQSSLPFAGFVFESIAEGGITRYVVLYQEDRPQIIGPVRSLRPYFTDFALTFDASVAHVGGSAFALQEARDLGIKDLDQFANGSSYWRATDRFAPHNVYTSFDLMDALNNAKGFTSSTFTSFARKAPQPIDVPVASNISVDISSFLYSTGYTYDPVANDYKRTLAGAPDLDRETGAQLNPEVVIVIEAVNTVASDGRYSYNLVGNGKVTVFQDGDVQVGTWSRTDRSSQFVFTDDFGNEIKLNPGQVWMTAISPSQEVVYTP